MLSGSKFNTQFCISVMSRLEIKNYWKVYYLLLWILFLCDTAVKKKAVLLFWRYLMSSKVKAGSVLLLICHEILKSYCLFLNNITICIM
jgi:hypothetical protein